LIISLFDFGLVFDSRLFAQLVYSFYHHLTLPYKAVYLVKATGQACEKPLLLLRFVHVLLDKDLADHLNVFLESFLEIFSMQGS